MEIKIRVTCEELPTAFLSAPADVSGDHRDIYLGTQKGEEMIEAVPAIHKSVIFEPSFRVLPLPGDQTNFLGPFAKGAPVQRFFYLAWATKGAGGQLTMFGRAKIHLSHLPWSVVEASFHAGKPLSVMLSLTDKRVRPRCGSIKGEDASWQS